MEQSNLIKINKLQHVGIPVTDLSASESFYNRLGFKNVMKSSFISEGEKGDCIMMENSGILVELYQMPGAQLQEIRTRKDGHVDHIAFDVDDIELTFKLLKCESFIILEGEPVYLPFWKNGCKYFNITGPDGERLEFNQIL